MDDADVGLPITAPNRTHVWYVYVIRSGDRRALREAMTERDIGTGIHFPIPVHLQPARRQLGYHQGDLPHTESAAHEVLSIPMYPELTDEQLQWVSTAIRSRSAAPA